MDSCKQHQAVKGKFTASVRGSLIVLCVAVIATGVRAQATQALSASVPDASPPSQLNMPLIGLDEGKRFQQIRTVQPSSVRLPKSAASGTAVAQTAPSLASVSGEVINERSVAPTLGHPLPASAMSPLGTPRADFAIDKGKTAIRAASATQSSKSALSNTVVQ